VGIIVENSGSIPIRRCVELLLSRPVDRNT